jgi:hypothetical protein
MVTVWLRLLEFKSRESGFTSSPGWLVDDASSDTEMHFALKPANPKVTRRFCTDVGCLGSSIPAYNRSHTNVVETTGRVLLWRYRYQ